MSFGIKPLGDRVVIKRFEAEEKTASGIILTESTKELPQMAEVITASPGDEKKDRKSTRLNSSHGSISYAVFCLKKKI